MPTSPELKMAAALLAILLATSPAAAQMHQHSPARADSSHSMKKMDRGVRRMTKMDMPTKSMPGMSMPGMSMPGMTSRMNGLYGPYPMAREASGTSWQPDAAEHRGIEVMRGPWMVMLHGMADLISDHQGGPRGDDKVYSANMLMGMAQRPLAAGTLGLRAMVSAEPATIGRSGYPLLLQTGETADGRTPLIDRQHPHDLFMELAASYSLSKDDRSIFFYGGLPGEPALGPPAFMHRFSGMVIPQAPLTHHWLDSSHITFGVLTAGAVLDRIKVEASAFRGREPDQDRWNIEAPKLDSHSFRLSVNPTVRWALQGSYGRLKSPEQLEPDVNQDRTTASAIYARELRSGHWEATLAWGRNRNRPGHTLDAFSAEAAAEMRKRHAVFVRLERVEKDELFVEPDPRSGQVFDVGEFTAGYRYDFWKREHLVVGAGAAGTLAHIPRELRDAYGRSPTSGVVFMRAAVK